ncbi:hypothetical protein HDU99_003287 [Rhizoclosmatium hyalinum]|nr:hypothetical protein HDU99_003287 [Rhizoclosmatium hyalinum]
MSAMLYTTTTTYTTTEVFYAKKNLPEEEKPILDQLIKFRQSLTKIKKESKGALTLSDVNSKAAELTNIVNTLRELRCDASFMVPRNRVDDVLDTIWMQMFYLWDKLVSIHSTLYPTYVSLVTLARTAEALKQSGAWTPADVEKLQHRLANLDEQVAVHQGKFVPNDVSKATVSENEAVGDHVPMGQAVCMSLLSRIHRTIQQLVLENESVGDELMPLKLELERILEKLGAMEKDGVAGYSLETLAPISKRLHAIDTSRGPTGNFCHSDSQFGHATIAGILNQCFEKLTVLVAGLDPVTNDSPLFDTYRALLAIHSDLVRIYANATTRSDPNQLSVALEVTQEKLQNLEIQRVDGSFVPPTATFDKAVKLAGQASMHKLLHDCHALISKLVDPVSLPVGEALVSTYELLIKQRTTLRKLRAYASAGWDVKRQLKDVEEVLKTVERGRVKGLFVGVEPQIAENAEFGDLNEEFGLMANGVPDGQATISALVDESKAVGVGVGVSANLKATNDSDADDDDVVVVDVAAVAAFEQNESAVALYKSVLRLDSTPNEKLANDITPLTVRDINDLDMQTKRQAFLLCSRNLILVSPHIGFLGGAITDLEL